MEGFRVGGKKREEVLSMEEFGGHKTDVKEIIEERERLRSAKKQGERGETLRDIRAVEGRSWNENVSARPNRLGEKD